MTQNPPKKNTLFVIAAVAIFCGLFILVPFKAKPYAIVLLLLVSMVSFFTNTVKPVIPVKDILIYSLFFMVYLVSAVYSEDTKSAVKIISRIVPLALIPWGICLLDPQLREHFIRLFKKTFVISCAIYVVMIFVYLYHLGYFDHTRSLLVCYSFIMNEFYGFNDHPIYLSMYFSIALLFLLTGIWTRKWLNFLLFSVIIVGLLLLARKGVILAFLIVSGIIVLKSFGKKQRFAIILVTMALFASSLLLPEIRNRFTELSNTDNIVNSTETSSGVRYIIWKTSAGLILEAPVLGYGVGDAQNVLDQRISDLGYDELLKGHYNAHNQYLQIGLSAGLAGVLLFVLSTGYFIRRFLLQGDFVSAAFLSFFAVMFFFESLMERQNGIIFYTFITSIFIFTGKSVKKEKYEQ